MEHSGTSFVQMLPPTVVICLLLTAGFFFYTRYVRTAAALCSALQKISGTVRSMADGDEMIRKTGLSRVFQGTQFEFIWRDFSKTLHTQTNLVNGALVEAIGSLFEAGVGEEYLAALVKQTSDSSDQAKSLKDELIQAMVPVIKQLESIQVDQANCIGQALEQALIEANRRLASQLETALVRQVKTPLEEMGKKMDARLSHIKSDPQDLARKVIRARMQDGHFESTPEAL
ncbi:hypothetical protein [Limnobacter litoralis]|uniref:Uncharacterized protein n=1 Tax=Limnobacter litoralis TaxID=481366 RepID=A0ABQ5YNM0_9BURK|nr:hypothetical protein [Limnobacter litoralis]GLR25390.1 hypothetical protein GCM10007875_04780 [Limnobacter litoralis]